MMKILKNLLRLKDSQPQYEQSILNKKNTENIMDETTCYWFERELDTLYIRHCFVRVMNVVCRINSEKKESIVLYDYLQDVLRQQFKYDLMTLFCQKNHEFIRETNFFPFMADYPFGELIQVNTLTDCLVSIPSEMKKLKSVYTDLKQGEAALKDYQPSLIWLEPFKIGFTDSAVHRLTVYQFGRERQFKAVVRDLSPLFSRVKTNGTHWQDLQTGKNIEPVFDYRLALIFEIEKRKRKLLDIK